MTEFNELKDTLFNQKVLGQKMKKIQNKKHKLRNQQVSLSHFDDKRFVLDDEIHTLIFHEDLE